MGNMRQSRRTLRTARRIEGGSIWLRNKEAFWPQLSALPWPLPDALISLRFEASYMTYSDNAVDSQYMTDRQLCQVAEAFDYSLVLNPDWDFIREETR